MNKVFRSLTVGFILMALIACSGNVKPSDKNSVVRMGEIFMRESDAAKYRYKLASSELNANVNYCHDRGYLTDIEYINISRLVEKLDSFYALIGVLDINDSSRSLYRAVRDGLDLTSVNQNVIQERCNRITPYSRNVRDELTKLIENKAIKDLRSPDDIQYDSVDMIKVYSFNGVKAATVTLGDEDHRYAVDIHGYLRRNN